MNISRNLMSAILSMDSYHRYNVGSKGLYVESVGDGDALSSIDHFIFSTPPNSPNGFAASAYEDDGTIYIAYTGTDGNPTDLIHGWIIGAGVFSAPQAQAAIEFLERVIRAKSTDTDWSIGDPIPSGLNIVLTGHSLGGGLAGYVASLASSQQVKAVLFDHMPFALAVNAAEAVETATKALWEIALSTTASAMLGVTAPTAELRLVGVLAALSTASAEVLGGVIDEIAM